MLVKADLAAAIKAALGNPTDKDGVPVAVTEEMEAYAEAVLTIRNATFAHALVTADGTDGSPITDGEAMGGIIAGLLAADWLTALAAGFGAAPGIAAEAAGSTAYLMANVSVDFEAGLITGTCTSTPSSGGPLLLGEGEDGVISGLAGSPWNTMAGALGPMGPAVYQAVADYLMNNAECSYAPGAVTGAFAAGGGAMTGGVGVGGTIQ